MLPFLENKSLQSIEINLGAPKQNTKMMRNKSNTEKKL